MIGALFLDGLRVLLATASSSRVFSDRALAAPGVGSITAPVFGRRNRRRPPDTALCVTGGRRRFLVQIRVVVLWPRSGAS